MKPGDGIVLGDGRTATIRAIYDGEPVGCKGGCVTVLPDPPGPFGIEHHRLSELAKAACTEKPGLERIFDMPRPKGRPPGSKDPVREAVLRRTAAFYGAQERGESWPV